jgi:Zn-dependent protease
VWGTIAFVFALVVGWGTKIFPALKFLPAVLKTGGTMLLSMGAYALTAGWQFGVGLVLLIFVHELGHLVAARKFGLRTGVPIFIPFMGAIIALKDAPRNAWMEAVVGIGGPIFGTLAAAVCYFVFLATGDPFWSHLAHFGFFLNLFNLAPVGFLDGGRIVTALSPWLWIVGYAVLGSYVAHQTFVMGRANVVAWMVLIMGLPRLFSLFRARDPESQRYFEVEPGQRWTMGTAYFGLIGLLVLGMQLTPLPQR